MVNLSYVITHKSHNKEFDHCLQVAVGTSDESY